MGKVTRLVRKAFGLKVDRKVDKDVTWEPRILNGRVALVPNRPLTRSTSYSWLRDRLLPLGDGGFVKVAGRRYVVKIPHRREVKDLGKILDPNTKFWLRSTNPRMGKVGPRRGTYDRLANDYDPNIGVLPILYLCEEQKPTMKEIIHGWLNRLYAVLRSLFKRVGEFAKRVGGYCKGYRAKHSRAGHWRQIAEKVYVWVSPCKVRGHYYAERSDLLA